MARPRAKLGASFRRVPRSCRARLGEKFVRPGWPLVERVAGPPRRRRANFVGAPSVLVAPGRSTLRSPTRRASIPDTDRGSPPSRPVPEPSPVAFRDPRQGALPHRRSKLRRAGDPFGVTDAGDPPPRRRMRREEARPLSSGDDTLGSTVTGCGRLASAGHPITGRNPPHARWRRPPLLRGDLAAGTLWPATNHGGQTVPAGGDDRHLLDRCPASAGVDGAASS